MAANGNHAIFSSFANIIAGHPSHTKETRHTVNPATLEALPEVPVSTEADVEAAVKAAKEAAKTWATVPLEEREQKIFEFADEVEAQSEGLAELLTREQGKPVGLEMLL